MSRRIGSLVLIVLGIVSGCAQFEHPLSPLEEAKLDQEVFGSWYAEQKGSDDVTLKMFVHIGEAKNTSRNQLDRNFYSHESNKNDRFSLKNLTRVVGVTMEPNGEITQQSWLVYPTQIGKHHYANVPVFKDGKIEGYFFWKYRVVGDKLFFWSKTDGDAVKELHEEGKLRDISNTNRIANSTAELCKLLQEGGDARLFPDSGMTEFRRLTVSE